MALMSAQFFVVLAFFYRKVIIVILRGNATKGDCLVLVVEEELIGEGVVWGLDSS